VISDIIRAACVKYIPHKTLSVINHHHRKPAWMNERAFTKIKKKKEAFSRYKDTRDGQHYLEYVKARNAAKLEARKAVRCYEKEIAKRAKKNPKAFYKYVNRKIKTKDSVGVLDSENGEAVTDKEKADLLNNIFFSVYTTEDRNTMTNKPRLDDSVLHLLEDVQFSEVDVTQLLLQLNVCRSPDSDNIHPRALK